MKEGLIDYLIHLYVGESFLEYHEKDMSRTYLMSHWPP